MKRNPRQAKKARQGFKLLRIVRASMKPGDVLVVRTDFVPSQSDFSFLKGMVGCSLWFLPADSKLDLVRGEVKP